MLLILYKTNDGSNVLNKTLTESFQIQINVRNDFDVINPIIFLTEVSEVNIRGYNYCEIQDLNRKYFIQDISLVNSKVLRLNCECDVLETYKDDVLNSNARFMRNIKTGDYFDASLDVNIKRSIETFESDKGFEGSPTMILTTVGA